MPATPPYWCVGILDAQSRKPCGRVVTPDAEPPEGWQPLCPRCLEGLTEALKDVWEAERRAQTWEHRVGDSVVYIAAREGFFKVGKSERGEVLRNRLMALARQQDTTIRPKGMTPGPLELLAVIPGAFDEERQIQRRLEARGFAAGGEWFVRKHEAFRVVARWIVKELYVPKAREDEIDTLGLITEAERVCA